MIQDGSANMHFCTAYPGEIEFCLNCKSARCYGVCDELREYRRKQGKPKYEDVRKELLRMTKKGMSAKKISEKYGVTENTIYHWLKKAKQEGVSK